uniref:Aquaporin n=1 Tax=Pyrodinium bahamense TaxID=73915 RepID=A0A7S0BDR0_9DINO
MAPKAPVSLAACMAEYNAMTLFVVFGCGSAMGVDGTPGETTHTLPGWVLMVSLAFGLTITALAYTHGHHSGGHINCAVTLGLVLSGHCEPLQGLANLFAQLLGSMTGAAILCLMYPPALDQTGGLGSNGVGAGWTWYNALTAEVLGTFLLMTVVLQTACSSKSEGNRVQAAMAIGFAVFIAHVVLIPIDGCSINPTRSFGPAVVSSIRSPESADLRWKDMWIFWVGPLFGVAIAAAHYRAMERLSAPVYAQAADEEQPKLQAETE